MDSAALRDQVKLDDAKPGLRVFYSSPGGWVREFGTIRQMNHKYVFVVFDLDIGSRGIEEAPSKACLADWLTEIK